MNYKNKDKHDFTCRICRVEDETLEHIFQCKVYEKELNLESDFSHLWIFSDNVEKISKTVEIIENILDVRQKHIGKEEKKCGTLAIRLKIVGTTS